MSHQGFRHLLTIGWLAAVLAIPATAGAQYPLEVLHEFSQPDGQGATAPLVQARDGNFYSTTGNGGTYDNGTIFRVTPSGAFAVIYNFTGGLDGGRPGVNALVQGRDGQLYGTTSDFGAFGDGIMFRVTLDGSLTVLHSFNGILVGRHPRGLILGTDGNFFGVTGPVETNAGAVFRATPTAPSPYCTLRGIGVIGPTAFSQRRLLLWDR
jgi:uncharacterized repeat protein (TIGR03803 family)